MEKLEERTKETQENREQLYMMTCIIGLVIMAVMIVLICFLFWRLSVIEDKLNINYDKAFNDGYFKAYEQKQTEISEDTCCFEYQAHTGLRPECEHGINCPYPNKYECERYRRLGDFGDFRFSHLRLFGELR